MDAVGDMVFVRVFGMNVLFLNSYEAVNELLHKRGALYSDRAHLVLACDMYVTSDTCETQTRD